MGNKTDLQINNSRLHDSLSQINRMQPLTNINENAILTGKSAYHNKDKITGNAQIHKELVNVDGFKVSDFLNLKSISINMNKSISTLPIECKYSNAVVYNNEIHILYRTNHYKWDGSTWTEDSTLPYDFYNGSAVVYNNEIHILGGSGNQTKHYKWDGTSWNSVSTLPYDFYAANAVVYNNEIHLLGINDNNTTNNKHYKWDGTSWNSVSRLPITSYDDNNRTRAIVYNNEIHLMGMYDTDVAAHNAHYTWNGSSWTKDTSLPYEFQSGGVIIINNEIHILGSETFFNTNHYSGGIWYN